MLVRKTLRVRSKNKKGGNKVLTRKNHRKNQQIGYGDDGNGGDEGSTTGDSGLSRLAEMTGFSEMFSTAEEPAEESTEESAGESAGESTEEPAEEYTLSDVSPIQSAFETYYGVDSGDVIADKPDVEYINLHKEFLERKNGSVVFTQLVKKGKDVAVLYHSSIGFKEGIFKYPACEFLENVSFPDSPPNAVVEIKKLAMSSTDRKGVYVKTMALVLKTLEEVLPGTVLNIPYVPSLSSTNYTKEESTSASESKETTVKSLEGENKDPEVEEIRIGSIGNTPARKKEGGSTSLISMSDLDDSDELDDSYELDGLADISAPPPEGTPPPEGAPQKAKPIESSLSSV